VRFSVPKKPAPRPNQPPVQWVLGLYAGGKAVYGSDHPPPSIAKGKEEVKINLYTLPGYSWPLMGEFSLYLHSYHRVMYITLHCDKTVGTLFSVYIYMPYFVYVHDIKTFTF
jgi:gamma-glutamylcyclotransferase (GGCT)/AIG2-like uncharacterized protein YtfP